MSENQTHYRRSLSGVALGFSVFVIVFFMVAALGAKFGLWSWMFGLGKLTFGWGPKLAIFGLGLSVIAVIASLVKAPRKQAFMLGLAALLVSGLTMGRILGVKGNSERLPPLHDIQTDWSAPIQPSETLVAIRKADGAMNSIEDAPVVPQSVEGRWPGTGGKLVSEIQENAEFVPGDQKSPKVSPYPKLAPLHVTGLAETDVFSAVTAVVTERDWGIVTDASVDGRVEATAVTGWFGFKDDVMVRVVSDDEGKSIVDVRSTSRVGLSDLGANSKRVRDLLDDLEIGLRKAGADVTSP